MRRKGISFVLLAVGLLGLAWVAHSKVAEARREVAYRAAIAPFERDLRLGMNRAEVQSYLASRKVVYHPVRYGGSDADTYEIEIGEEPGSLFCEEGPCISH